MTSNQARGGSSPEKDAAKEFYLELGISFLFLTVLLAFMIQQQLFEASFGFVMLLLTIILSVLGYLLLLNEKLEEYLKFLLSRVQLQRLARILTVPSLTILILVVSLLSGHTTVDFENTLLPNTMLYLIYVLVPVMVAEGMTTKKSSLNHVITLSLGLFIIIWGWWFIEFDWLPSIVSGIPLEEFIGLLATGWSFLIILSHEIPRNVSRYLQLDTFKIVGMWFLILFMAIVPAALQSEFIAFGLNESIINQGVLAIVLAALVFLGIFFFTGFVEEFLFRGLIFQWTTNHLSTSRLSQTHKKAILLPLFGFVSVLIFLTPYFGLANPVTAGPYKNIPLPVVYAMIGILYLLIGILIVFSSDNTELIVLLWSSMVFGWAHFEDWRYVVFATIAGIGYCDTYRRTRNVFAAATLHALVDFIWGMAFAG